MAPAGVMISAEPQTQTQAALRGWMSAWACLLFPLASGALLWACHFPLAWGWLGWVALVPFLFLVRMEARPRALYVCAYLAGCAFFWPVLQWMPVAHPMMLYTWAMLATYCAFYFPVGLWLLRRLDRGTGWPLTLTLPIVWTGLEFVRSFLLTGFAWYYLGHTQHQFLALIQITDLAGVYAVSFLLAAVNGWLFEWLFLSPTVRAYFRQPAPPPRKAPPPWKTGLNLPAPARQGIVVAGLLLATLAYGGWRLSQDEFKPGPRIALLQGNLDAQVTNAAAGPGEDSAQKAKKILEYYRDLCFVAWKQKHKPDLVVWPETSYPYEWYVLPDDLNKLSPAFVRAVETLQAKIREFPREMAMNHLFGIDTRVVSEDGKRKRYNSGLLLNAYGHNVGRYDKIHRVPFGEFVPFGDWLPFMKNFVPYDFDYSIRIGEKMTRFPLLDRYHFGVLICYEDTDPYLARQYARAEEDGPAVDFLVNISNDGWFDGTSEHEEHLAISRFRAIECRRALVRAVNMGVSAVIDSNGRVQKPRRYPNFQIKPPTHDEEKGQIWVVEPEIDGVPDLPLASWRDFKKVSGVMTATVPLDDRVSLYALAGDWLPIVCWLVMGGVIVRTRYLAKRRTESA